MTFLVNKEKMMTLALCLVATYGIMLLPSGAFAGDVIGDTLCGVAAWFTGTLGQGIATLAILVIGVGALMGKVSWGMAIIVGIGVAVIFGAPQIVSQLGEADGCEV